MIIFRAKQRYLVLALLQVACLCPVWAQEKVDIGAIGFLSPRGQILGLAGTPGTRITEVLVTQNQEVPAGAVLVKFDNHEILKAEFELARLGLEEAQKNMKFKYALQDLAFESASMALNRALVRLQNYQKLEGDSLYSYELVVRQHSVEDARGKVSREKLLLEQVEMELELELRKAKSTVKLAQAKFDRSFLSAPVTGTILEIVKQSGQSIGSEPVIRIADLSEMYAICEVYEGDLLKIIPGLKATVTANSLASEITGTVERIGRIVNRNSRLAKIWIKLDQVSPVSRLLGMEVSITIHL